MKLLVDIPTECYNVLQKYGPATPSDVAIINGIILPKHPSNGDMLKAIFPDLTILDDSVTVRRFKSKDRSSDVQGIATTRWWDAPYEQTKHTDNEGEANEADS